MIMMMKKYYVYSMFYFKLSSVGVAINNFNLIVCTQRETMLNILARTNIYGCYILLSTPAHSTCVAY
jgi:hypothetical protein